MLFSIVLKDNKGFQRCFKSGRFCSCYFLTAYYVQNNSPQNKVGISVSKKVGNAVQRNRAKRIIRAAYRICEDKFPIGYDIVFVARPSVNDKKMQDVSGFFCKRLIDDMNTPSAKRKKSGKSKK
jgi:ribonuclease P protein component